LSAAAQLNQAGHSVTVYEKDDRPGGLLMYGIPNMKLDKEEVVMRRIRVLEAEGINFVCKANIGVDIVPEKLIEENDAVILCIGAGKPRDLPVEGRDLKGIHFAMEFLTANTKAILENKATPISAEGKDVVIIGGGDTGTDCVGTSVRHGCKNLVQLEIMPKPPLTRANNNPWPEYPKIYKLDYGQEEAAAKFGHDPRVYTTMTTRFEGDGQGNVAAVHTVEVEWKRNEQGRFIPVPIAGTEKRLPAQLVLLAMGFLGPEQLLLDKMGIETTERSNIKAEYGKYSTSIPNVFCCRRLSSGSKFSRLGF
jgi:glutamate synthase (NADPH/NADH) small chain